MEALEEEDEERFKKQFSTYLEDGIGSDDIEEIFSSAYEKIREDPEFKPTEKTKNWAAESKKFRQPRLSKNQRDERIQAKIKAFQEGQDEE